MRPDRHPGFCHLLRFFLVKLIQFFICPTKTFTTFAHGGEPLHGIRKFSRYGHVRVLADKRIARALRLCLLLVPFLQLLGADSAGTIYAQVFIA